VRPLSRNAADAAVNCERLQHEWPLRIISDRSGLFFQTVHVRFAPESGPEARRADLRSVIRQSRRVRSTGSAVTCRTIERHQIALRA
jgi:hypothetical protein